MPNAAQREKATIDLVINGQQSKATLYDIGTAATNARKALSRMAETDPGYAKQKEQLEALMRAQMQRIVRINDEKTAWEKFKDRMPTITTSIVGANLVTSGLSAIAGAIPAAIAKYREFNAASKELSAVTGLTGKDLEYMNQQARKVGPEVGKSAAQMLEAYKLMGSAKPELLANKELLAETTKAAITLSQAGKIDLAEATKVTAESLNQFGEGADQANRYVNVIAAGAKEGSAEINEMGGALKNAGTVAKAQGLSFEQTNAILQSMSTIALKGGEAGTGLRNVLLTLGSGSDDTNPRVVGLQTALGNLAKQNLSTAEMTKLFGKENLVAAQHIITHRDEIGELTRKVTGTSEAFSQAKTNNESYDHQMEVFNARLDGLVTLIGTRLIPMFTGLLSGGIELVKMLTGGLTPASEAATQAFEDQRSKVQDLQKNLVPLLDRHDELKKKTVLTKDEQAELKKIVGQVADVVPSAATEFDKYGNALDVNTQKARDFIKVQKELLKYNNREALEETDSELEAKTKARALALAKLNAGKVTEFNTKSMGGGYSTRALTDQEKTALRAELASISAEIDALEARKTGLNGDYLNAPSTPAATPAATPPTGGGKSGPTDEQKKKAAAQVNSNQEALLAIEKQKVKAITDDRTRELAQADLEANQERERARKSKATADLKAKWIKGIDDELLVHRSQIEEKYTLKAKEEAEKQFKEKQKQSDELLKLALKEMEAKKALDLQAIAERVGAGGITKEQGKLEELQVDERFLLAKELLYQTHYAYLYDLAFASDELTNQLDVQQNESSADLEKARTDNAAAQAEARGDIREEEADHARRLSDEEHRRNVAEREFRQKALSELSGLLTNDWSSTLENYKSFWRGATLVQKAGLIATKAYALAEIGINLARQITAINTMAGIMNAIVPFSGEAIRFPGIAKAIGMAAIQTAGVISSAAAGGNVPAFALGGFTDQEPGGFVDGPTFFTKRGYVAGEKGREWVMSAPMLSNPVFANLAGAMQAMQANGSYRNVRQGSDLAGSAFGIGSDTKASLGMSHELGMAILSELQQSRVQMGEWARRPILRNYRLDEEYDGNVIEARQNTL